jgi:Hpt domain
MEPEDADAVLERSVPADLGTTHVEESVDREVLARLRRLQGEDEPDIVAELTGMFLKDARSRLEAVEEALQKGDAPAVERAAHALKAGRAAWAQGECPVSARSWRTSVHR